jgi:ABC-type Fe3+-hydroxamate transport system substrate-binding protein
MTVGGDTFINNMLRYCGFINVFQDQKRYPSIEIDDLKWKEVDLILLSSEPYPFKEKHIAEIKAILPQAKILLVDGEMFSWYGSRLEKAPQYFKKLQQQIDSL